MRLRMPYLESVAASMYKLRLCCGAIDIDLMADKVGSVAGLIYTPDRYWISNPISMALEMN
jgi:hypothetical protein